ncbi:tetratricopeptide repeat-containing sensor histidine kinase [Ferruginibacter sp.]
MQKKYFLLLLLLFAVANLTAQRILADSIEIVLKKEMPDSDRAVTMVNRAMFYEVIDSAKAEQYYEEALDFAVNKKLYYPAGLSIRYRLVPKILKGNFVNIDDINKAVKFLSLSANKKARKQEGLLMGDKASYFYINGQYDSAIAWNLKGISVLEKNNYYNQTGTLYTNISNCYEVLHLKDKQKEYVIKGLEASKKSGESYIIFGSFLMVSQLYAGEKDYKKAMQYCDSAMLYYKENLSNSRMQLYYLMRAQAYEGLEKYDSSVHYYNKAYTLTKNNNDEWGMNEPLLRMGFGYMKLNKPEEAESFLHKGIDLAEKNNVLIFKRTGYELMSKFYEESGNYKKALEAYKKYYDANDSLQHADSKKTILDLDKKYETEKKEKQLLTQESALRQKNTINYILISSIAALLLISLLAYRTYKQKRKLQEQKIIELEKEKLLLATQSIVKGQEDERSRLAKDLHDGLGGLLSGVKLQLGAMKGNLILSEEHGRTFNNALSKLDESISEMRRVAHNMMPEALMKLGLQQALQDYCDGLSESQSFKINGEFYGLEKRMESSVEIVVYRIVQELLNNAVKHSGAAAILVQVMKHDNNLTITVEDNGKGFNKDEVLLMKGTGLKNIQSRVDYLKGQLDIQSTPGKGTSVHIDCIIDSNA